MTVSVRFCCAGLACFVGVTPAFAQSRPSNAAASTAAVVSASESGLPELITDRPDITESSTVVGAGIWQLETGLVFDADRASRVTTRDLSAPNALLRLGIGSRFELRLGGEGFLSESQSTPGVARDNGMSDLEVAFKYVFLDQDKAGIDAAVIPIVSLPAGSDRFSSGSVDPTVKLTVSRDFAHGFGLGGNVIVASITEDGERFTQTALSLSLGHGLGDGWGGFWELYGASAQSLGGGQAWLFDTGVTRALGENAQVDVSVGRGLTDAASDWFIGAGFAIRGRFRR